MLDRHEQTYAALTGELRPVRMRCRRTPAARLQPILSPPQQPCSVARGRETTMQQSHVVEIDGAFVGAAVRQSDGYRFVAVDVRLDEIDGRVWPTLVDLRRQVRVMVLAGRGPARRLPAADCLA